MNGKPRHGWRTSATVRIIRTMRLPLRTLLLCSLLGACGDSNVARSPGGNAELLAQATDAKELGALLDRHGKANVVFAHSLGLGRAALASLSAEQRARVKLVVANVPSGEARTLVADGTFDATAEHAVDCGDAGLALAAMAGRRVEVHNHFALGVRWFTKANLAADGARVPAPGDLALEVLRRQHPAPATDALLQIVCIADGSSAWCRAVLADLNRKANRHQGTAVISKSVDRTEDLGAALDGTETSNPAAIVLITEAAAPSAAARQRALARACRVIVLGEQPADAHYTSHVGADRETLGRAAGTAIRQLHPDDARIVELGGDTAVHAGFAKELKLASAR